MFKTKLVRLSLVNTFTFPRITLHVAVELPFHLLLREKLLQIYFCSWFMSKFTSLGNDEADRNWILNTTNSMARGWREKNVFIIKFPVSTVLFLPFLNEKRTRGFSLSDQNENQKSGKFIYRVYSSDTASCCSQSDFLFSVLPRSARNLSKFIFKPR